jgi:hypothetical protein
LRRRGLGASEISPGERDSGAGVAERLRHGSSQSARTAGYEYRRAIEVRHPGSLMMVVQQRAVPATGDALSW